MLDELVTYLHTEAGALTLLMGIVMGIVIDRSAIIAAKLWRRLDNRAHPRRHG